MPDFLIIIFNVIASALSIYSILCFIRIMLTWIPQIAYSKFAQILSKICDPYLNLFRRFRWMIIGSLDFSPAIAICILSALAELFKSIASGGSISIGVILSIIIELVWAIASSLVFFFLLVLVVRLIILLVNKNNYNSGNYIIEQIDRTISPVLYNIGKTFTGGKRITYRTALIIGIVVFVLILIAGSILFNYLAQILASLPF